MERCPLPMIQTPKPVTLTNQQTFSFKNITITSDFNSGNWLSCREQSPTSYALEIASDCQCTQINHKISSYKVWFYFGVKSVSPETITLTITNFNNFLRLFKQGYEIVYNETEHSSWSNNEFENSYTENEEEEWKRLHYNIDTKLDEVTNTIEISWNFTITPNQIDKYVLFAFCFPWSYNKNNAFLRYHLQKYQAAKPWTKIYFHKEVLVLSKEKNEIHLLTLTSKENVLPKQYEKTWGGWFPYSNNPSSRRCWKSLHDKPIIFISARVHPNETPGAFMMNGILKTLLDENNKNSELLRKHFVFKIIPIINVDGLCHGHLRLDNTGINWNRCYINPDNKKDVEVYAIKKWFMLYSIEYKVRYYFDLHADLNCKGVYTFGNAINDYLSQVENVLFSYVFSLNCSHVNWDNCRFSEGCMKTKFKYERNSKEASSRVNFYKTTGWIHCYTIESSYFKGEYKANTENLYTIKDIEETGEKLLYSIWDYDEWTVSNNILESEHKDLSNCRLYIAGRILNTEERYKFVISLKNTAKDINTEKTWLSMKEIEEKYNSKWPEIKGNVNRFTDILRKRIKSQNNERLLRKKSWNPERKNTMKHGEDVKDNSYLADMNTVRNKSPNNYLKDKTKMALNSSKNQGGGNSIFGSKRIKSQTSLRSAVSIKKKFPVWGNQ